MKNTTEKDAFERLVDARMGSLVDATDEYVVALRNELLKWVEELDGELYRRDMAAAAQDEFDDEPPGVYEVHRG